MKKIIICVNYRANPNQPSCAARGSTEIAVRIEQEAARQGIPVELERIYCLGYCEQGPNLRLIPNGRFFHRFDCKDIPQLLSESKGDLRDETPDEN